MGVSMPLEKEAGRPVAVVQPCGITCHVNCRDSVSSSVKWDQCGFSEALHSIKIQYRNLTDWVSYEEKRDLF